MLFDPVHLNAAEGTDFCAQDAGSGDVAFEITDGDTTLSATLLLSEVFDVATFLAAVIDRYNVVPLAPSSTQLLFPRPRRYGRHSAQSSEVPVAVQNPSWVYTAEAIRVSDEPAGVRIRFFGSSTVVTSSQALSIGQALMQAAIRHETIETMKEKP